MDFVKKYFVNILTKKYFAFEGTAKRDEFWYYLLICFVIFSILSFVFSPIAALFGLGVLLPSLSICARRLRDAGFSPWLLLILLTGIGSIVILVLCAFRSKK